MNFLADSSAQYCAMLNDSDTFDLKLDNCTTHKDDKIGKSAIGDLMMSKNKVIVNPFHKGRNLLKKMHDQYRHLTESHSNRLKCNKFLH